MPFLPFLGLRILLIGYFSTFKKCKNSQKTKFRAPKCVKMAESALLESPKLISRKIWLIEKSWNFHTALQVPKYYSFLKNSSSHFIEFKFHLAKLVTLLRQQIIYIVLWRIIMEEYDSEGLTSLCQFCWLCLNYRFIFFVVLTKKGPASFLSYFLRLQWYNF